MVGRWEFLFFHFHLNGQFLQKTCPPKPAHRGPYAHNWGTGDTQCFLCD